ncbi:hypothetical protein B1R32_11440 [Abditibacterium utsteinense]|uniref:Cytochrome c domain-containing protein n=1 Tax=Abditibacterium utsteinense TaxID=1960156 RepID=A0A2S8SR06_9BACT|nr:hypothetical protein [Abditibacterium utsteinense]PQV63215.1 hypothetical protein B1R32_11440 [Abditibacterium utsteinense]
MKPLLLLGLALFPLGVLRAQTAAPTEPIHKKSSGEKNAKGFAPLGYFDANCARCHGPNGSFYGAGFGKNLKDDAALKQIVKEMCEGPGNAPLNEKSLDILTDFHRALRDNKPFLVIVSQSAKTLSGEASPDATLALQSGEKTLPIALKGHNWTTEIPADFNVSKARLVARRGEQVAEIALKTD